MRREHSEVKNPKEIERILSLTNVGRLATTGQDGFPYITPLNFVSLEGMIYFHCAPKGEKLDNLRRDPRVCFEVDIPLAYLDIAMDPSRPICQLHQYYHCVIIRGTASVVEDSTRKVVALNALVKKHEITEDFPPVTADMSATKACVVVEVKPVSVTAKSDLGQNVPEKQRESIAQYLFKRDQPGDRQTVVAMGYDFS